MLSPDSDDEYELSFRMPMEVRDTTYYLRSMTAYPRCPRCRLTLDREYMSFCDRCGQRLDWRRFDQALVLLVP